MISYVSGRVAALGPEQAVVEVGGVGLAVQATPGTIAGLRIGEHATLATSLVVREDSLTLYGFVDDDERTVFELLQTASGVGPRLAQAALAVLSPDALRLAVATEDLVTLTSVPGIGRKGAQRIVLELKDRLGAPTGGVATVDVRTPSGSGWEPQVHAALLGLGWSAREADDAVAAVQAQADQSEDAGSPDAADVGSLLRAALQTLGRAR